jgi:hypothetical protein
MMAGGSMRSQVRSPVALLLAFLLAAPAAAATAPPAAAPAGKGLAQVRGVLLDPEGMPAQGYQVALRGKAGDLFISAPSGVDGAFVIDQLPPGAYRMAAFAPDGAEFPVLAKEISLSAGQVERIEIQLAKKGFAPGRAETPPAGETAAKPGKKGGLSKGAIIGIVVGGVAAVALVLSGGGGDETPPAMSPTLP